MLPIYKTTSHWVPCVAQSSQASVKGSFRDLQGSHLLNRAYIVLRGLCREERNISYREQTGLLFPYSLLGTRKPGSNG